MWCPTKLKTTLTQYLIDNSEASNKCSLEEQTVALLMFTERYKAFCWHGSRLPIHLALRVTKMARSNDGLTFP